MKIPKEIRNALIIGLVVLFSNLAFNGDISYRTLYTAFVSGILTGLIELAHSYGLLDRLDKMTTINRKNKSKGIFNLNTFFL